MTVVPEIKPLQAALAGELCDCLWWMSVTNGRRGVLRYLGRRLRTRQLPDPLIGEGTRARQQRRSSHHPLHGFVPPVTWSPAATKA